MHCLVLDAMGVIFQAADDVAELLVPFVLESNGVQKASVVEDAYLKASLGLINADKFWNEVGLDSSVEDTYLSRHSLMPGVKEFLENIKDANIHMWCLSNDVERWSRKLRYIFDLDKYFSGIIISSAVGLRKPSPEIYQKLLEQIGDDHNGILFVDDREKNVAAALSMGIKSHQFCGKSGFALLERQLIEGVI